MIMSSLAVRLAILCNDWLFMDGVASPARPDWLHCKADVTGYTELEKSTRDPQAVKAV